MLRTRPVGQRYVTGGKAAGIVAALAATGLLAACGGNDSTASSTPSLSPASTSAAASSTQSEPSSAQPAPEAPAPDQQEQQAPAEPSVNEEPAPVQPTPQEPELSDTDKAYLAELSKHGLNPSSPSIALTAANYICQSKKNGAPDAEVKTFVNAMAGTDPAFDPQKMSVDQAGQIYIDVATTHYCNK